MPLRLMPRTSRDSTSEAHCNAPAMRRFAGLVLATAFLLTGCGGGSGGSGDGGGSTPPPTPPPPSTFSVSTSTNGSGTGSISPTSVNVTQGGSAIFEITPASSSALGGVTGCNGSLAGTTYTTGTINANCTVTVTFNLKSYTVNATAQEGGSISPSTATVDHGDTVSFEVAPSAGYSIDAVTGCGGSLSATTYTTGPITADCQVDASFLADPVNFLDQLQGDYGGQMRSPKNIFFLDSTTLSVAIDGDDVDITKDAFFGRTCLMDGKLAGESYPVTGNGSFRCSDFSEGSWTSPKIVKIDDTTLLATFSMDDGTTPYSIRFGGFGGTTPSGYNPDQDYWLTDAPLADFSGFYDGQMKSVDSCAGFSFSSTSAELSVQVDGDNVEMVRDSFFDGICEFSGTRDSFADGVLQASGTFRCSNFDEGTWTSERIVMADPDVLFANLRVSVPSRACSYTVRHIVFK
jgi:hypothetical protein